MVILQLIKICFFRKKTGCNEEEVNKHYSNANKNHVLQKVLNNFGVILIIFGEKKFLQKKLAYFYI